MGAAGEGSAELVGLGHHTGIPELLPDELPGLLPTRGHYAAVDGGAQVRGDPARERRRVRQETFTVPTLTTHCSTTVPWGLLVAVEHPGNSWQHHSTLEIHSGTEAA